MLNIKAKILEKIVIVLEKWISLVQMREHFFLLIAVNRSQV